MGKEVQKTKEVQKNPISLSSSTTSTKKSHKITTASTFFKQPKNERKVKKRKDSVDKNKQPQITNEEKAKKRKNSVDKNEKKTSLISYGNADDFVGDMDDDEEEEEEGYGSTDDSASDMDDGEEEEDGYGNNDDSVGDMDDGEE